MKVTKACDYAMRALIFMGRQPPGTVFLRSELSKISKVPDSFLGKILQSLVKADILTSERGKNGGFKLLKNISEISMYDVIIAVEGKLYITECVEDTSYCEFTDKCKAHLVWKDIQESLVNQLKSKSIQELV